MPETILTPDICIIGGGSAGLSLAAGAAAFGVETVLIERDRMGGECLNTGCVPSKALLAAASRAGQVRDAARFGVVTASVEIDFGRVMAFVREAIGQIAPHDSVQRFESLGVRVLSGDAQFEDQRTVRTGDIRIRARRFVVATGSAPRLPDVPGLADTPFLTHETVFALAHLPVSLAILGAGASGVEFARAFARLGTRVTLIDRAAMLPDEDAEAVAFLRTSLTGDGVEIIENATVLLAQEAGQGVSITLGTTTGERCVQASHLLVAAGRQPRVAGLGLERAGVGFDDKGIATDGGLRTSNPRVYAIGDVLGKRQFTHLANAESGLVLRSILFRLPGRSTRLPVPRVIHGGPDLAQIGLTEAEARASASAGGVRIRRMDFTGSDAAVTEGETTGFLKLVTDGKGRLLGATIAGEAAAGLAPFFVLALDRRLKLQALSRLVLPYPSLAETGRHLALQHMRPLAANRLVRAVVRLLSRFG